MLLSYLLNRYIRCPACGSTEVRLFDQGFKRVQRLLALNPRLICSVCRTSWRRRRPEHLVKVKRKKRLPKLGSANAFKVKSAPDNFWEHDDATLSTLVDLWQEDGTTKFCLDLQGQHPKSENHIRVFTHLYHLMRERSYDFLVIGGSDGFYDYLWKLGIGHLIWVDQDLYD